MEFRITRVFSPFARAVAFFLSELEVSPTGVAGASFIAAALSLVIFLTYFRIPFFSVELLFSAAVALIFLNAFFDDVERRIEVRRKRKSVFGGPLGTFLGQVSDAFIVIGALVFLASKDTYYNFGSFFIFNLNYVEPGFTGHIGLGVVIITGILLLRYLINEKKEKVAGLWTRSERMYLLGFFAAGGLIQGMFSGLLFTGLIVLTVFLYISILKRAVNITFPSLKVGRASFRIKRLLIGGATSIGGFIRWALKSILKIVGVILLGAYMFFEKIYLAILKIPRAFRNMRPKKTADTRKYSYKHPPLKPFEGTIAPSPSTLPADEEKSALEQGEPTGEFEEEFDEGEEPLQAVEESSLTIELPPPARLMDGEAFTVSEEVGESMLVEFEPTAKKEEVIVSIVDFMIGRERMLSWSLPSLQQNTTKIDLPGHGA